MRRRAVLLEDLLGWNCDAVVADADGMFGGHFGHPGKQYLVQNLDVAGRVQTFLFREPNGGGTSLVGATTTRNIKATAHLCAVGVPDLVRDIAVALQEDVPRVTAIVVLANVEVLLITVDDYATRWSGLDMIEHFLGKKEPPFSYPRSQKRLPNPNPRDCSNFLCCMVNSRLRKIESSSVVAEASTRLASNLISKPLTTFFCHGSPWSTS